MNRASQIIAIVFIGFLTLLTCFLVIFAVPAVRYDKHVVARGKNDKRQGIFGGVFMSKMFLGGLNGWVSAYIPKAHDTPFLDWRTHIPQAAALADAHPVIKREALRVYKDAPTYETLDGLQTNLATNDKKPWGTFVFKYHRGWNEKNCAQCPQTAALLKSIPNIQLAMFSIFPPGKRLKPHCGPWRGVARLHLGVVVPSEADGRRPWIRVGGEKYCWKEGELVLFDDTFTHEAVNETDQYRIVLFCDIDRHDIPETFVRLKNKLGAAYFAGVNKRAESKAAQP